MATSESRPPRMDVKTMYPNFYIEQHNHHVQENSTMAASRKRRDGLSGSTRRDEYGSASRPRSRSGQLMQLKQRAHTRDNSLTRQTPMSSADRVIPPIVPRRNSNQQEAVTPALQVDYRVTATGRTAPMIRPSSRQVALRGELSLTSPAWEDDTTLNGVGVSPGLRPAPFSAALAGSAHASLEITTARLSSTLDGESLEDLVINARTRPRYARRVLHRQGSAKTLARISTAPTTLRGHQSLNGSARNTTPLNNVHSTGNLLATDSSRRPSSRQAVQIAVIHAVEQVLSGTEADDGTDDDDDTNFFLTELEAAARAVSAASAAKLRVLARHVTLGSFLLYGNPPALEAAIQHFTAALKSVEPSPDDVRSSKSNFPALLALISLLHHHRGVALRELVVASTSTTSKSARLCTKHAFAEQRRALKLAQRAQDPRLQARAIKALGLLLLDAHAYDSALTHQQEALQIALEEKDRELEARVYANLGNLALAQLNFGHALSCHHRDLQLCSSKVLDCRLGCARAHKNLSIVYAKLHRRDQQLHHEKEARMAAFKDGGGYLYDIATHTDSSVGNICLQSSTDIDPALVSLVTQNLAEIVRGLAGDRSGGSTLGYEADNSIIKTLEQEWSTAEIDLEAAIASVSSVSTAEAEIQVNASDKQPFATSSDKSPSQTGHSRPSIPLSDAKALLPSQDP